MSSKNPQRAAPRAERKRRSDGEQSRNAILDAAANLATVEGIGGLSIGRLADEVGMSKSGLFAHFGSKEDLQSATLESAAEVFQRDVLETVADLDPGIDRLRAMIAAWLRYVQTIPYRGGCFFAAA